MSEQKTAAPIVDETEEEYVDYADPKAVHEALTKAWKEYAWPSTGAIPSPGGKVQWERKKGKLRPKKQTFNEAPTSKFKIPRLEKILAYLAMGLYMEEVCSIVGVTTRNVSLWIARGESEKKGPYWVFARAVLQMSACVEANYVRRIHNFVHAPRLIPSKDAAEMAFKYLERRFPKRWRNGVDVTTNGKDLPSEGRKLKTLIFKIVDATTATQDPQPVQEQKDYDEKTAAEGKSIFDDEPDGK